MLGTPQPHRQRQAAAAQQPAAPGRPCHAPLPSPPSASALSSTRPPTLKQQQQQQQQSQQPPKTSSLDRLDRHQVQRLHDLLRTTSSETIIVAADTQLSPPSPSSPPSLSTQPTQPTQPTPSSNGKPAPKPAQVYYLLSIRLLRRYPDSVLAAAFPLGIPPDAVLTLGELDAVLPALRLGERLALRELGTGSSGGGSGTGTGNRGAAGAKGKGDGKSGGGVGTHTADVSVSQDYSVSMSMSVDGGGDAEWDTTRSGDTVYYSVANDDDDDDDDHDDGGDGDVLGAGSILPASLVSGSATQGAASQGAASQGSSTAGPRVLHSRASSSTLKRIAALAQGRAAVEAKETGSGGGNGSAPAPDESSLWEDTDSESAVSSVSAASILLPHSHPHPHTHSHGHDNHGHGHDNHDHDHDDHDEDDDDDAGSHSSTTSVDELLSFLGITELYACPDSGNDGDGSVRPAPHAARLLRDKALRIWIHLDLFFFFTGWLAGAARRVGGGLVREAVTLRPAKALDPEAVAVSVHEQADPYFMVAPGITTEVSIPPTASRVSFSSLSRRPRSPTPAAATVAVHLPPTAYRLTAADTAAIKRDAMRQLAQGNGRLDTGGRVAFRKRWAYRDLVLDRLGIKACVSDGSEPPPPVPPKHGHADGADGRDGRDALDWDFQHLDDRVYQLHSYGVFNGTTLASATPMLSKLSMSGPADGTAQVQVAATATNATATATAAAMVTQASRGSTVSTPETLDALVRCRQSFMMCWWESVDVSVRASVGLTGEGRRAVAEARQALERDRGSRRRSGTGGRSGRVSLGGGRRSSVLQRLWQRGGPAEAEGEVVGREGEGQGHDEEREDAEGDQDEQTETVSGVVGVRVWVRRTWNVEFCNAPLGESVA
ncbi:hypothetical protein BC831DRAFT_121040 [Entophlyctis helioformis]|nr:hypothetical protein BC831DRAFT_121040 [Entophlyctis helioformis]